jgi:hypothetical protein
MRVALIGWAALGLTACSHSQASRPTRYILKSGASGWVKIIYNRSDAPELPVQDGFAVVNVLPDMVIRTRSPMNSTWDGSEFYYQTPDGKRVKLSSKDDAQRLLWGLDKTSDSNGDRESFFVGKDSEFNQTSAHITDITSESDLKAPLVKALNPAEPSLGEPTISEEERLKVLTAVPK